MKEKDPSINGMPEALSVNEAFERLANFTVKYRTLFATRLAETHRMYMDSGLRMPMNILPTRELRRDLKTLKPVFDMSSSRQTLECYSDLMWDIHFREPKHEEPGEEYGELPVDFQELANIMKDPSMRDALEVSLRRINMKRRAGKENGSVPLPQFSPELTERVQETLGMSIDEAFYVLLRIREADI